MESTVNEPTERDPLLDESHRQISVACSANERAMSRQQGQLNVKYLYSLKHSSITSLQINDRHYDRQSRWWKGICPRGGGGAIPHVG